MIMPYRIQCALSRRTLAHVCNVAESTVRRWELDIRQPNMKHQRQIAALLGESLPTLFMYIDPQTGKTPSNLYLTNLTQDE